MFKVFVCNNACFHIFIILAIRGRPCYLFAKYDVDVSAPLDPFYPNYFNVKEFKN